MTTTINSFSFLDRGGEMGQLIRQYDWSATSLGSPDQWPQSLRTTLSIVLNSRFPMFLFWGEELLCFYNDAYRPSLGIAGKHPGSLGKPGVLVWPEIWSVIKPLIDQVVSGGEATWSEDQYIPIYRNGRLEDVYWTYSYSPVMDETGRIAGVFVTCTETTSKVLAQQRLQKSQQQILNYFEQSPVGIAILSVDQLTFRMANSFYCQLVGRPVEELVDKPLLEALPEIKGQGFDALLETVIATGVAYTAYEVPANIVRKGQLETIYVDLAYQPQKQPNESVTGVLVIATDVTKQVLARKSIEISEERLRSLVESAPFPIAVYVGSDMIIELANESIMKVWGKGYDVVGKSYKTVLPELASQPVFSQVAGVLATGIPFHARHQRVDLVVDGRLQPFYFNYSFTPLFDQEGKVYGVMNTAAEVTDLILARQELEASESRFRKLAAELEQQVLLRTEELAAINNELASANQEYAAINEELEIATRELTESNTLLVRSNENLQRFAYVASHDLQEPLRKIQQFGDLLKTRNIAASAEDLNYLERMQLAASRMSVLIRDLLNFSRISTHRETNTPVSLHQVLGMVLTDLELAVEETEARITIESLPTVMGDGSQLGQLFNNLLSNALKFRRNGVPPVIRVTSERVPAGQLPPEVRPGRGTGWYHQIQVIDNGIGFDETYLDRIFQVFQRLHGKGEFVGTGIGLAICEKVVANHGGAITARSKPGQGATFIVYLPD